MARFGDEEISKLVWQTNHLNAKLLRMRR